MPITCVDRAIGPGQKQSGIYLITNGKQSPESYDKINIKIKKINQ